MAQAVTEDRAAEELAPPETPTYTLWQLVAYSLKLGTIGFG
jgi:hypothetical protein